MSQNCSEESEREYLTPTFCNSGVKLVSKFLLLYFQIILYIRM